MPARAFQCLKQQIARAHTHTVYSCENRLMVFVHEAIARGLSIALGLPHDDNLSKLCEGGDTISLMRLFHYFPYENNAGKHRVTYRGQNVTIGVGRSVLPADSE